LAKLAQMLADQTRSGRLLCGDETSCRQHAVEEAILREENHPGRADFLPAEEACV
jgi:hypothetical protein